MLYKGVLYDPYDFRSLYAVGKFITQALDCPNDLLCTESEVLEMLCTLDTSKASGPDGISRMMLKYTACSTGPILTKLFNLSIRTGTLPVKPLL